MASFGRVVLSYHDSLLRESDLQLLNAPNWLNDNLISFYFEYLQHDLCSKHESDLHFISPPVAQLLRLLSNNDFEPDLIGLSADKIRSKQLILIPVNDSNDRDSPGGSHWTLLTIRRQPSGSMRFEHYDSSRGSANRQCAVQLAQTFAACLKLSDLEKRVHDRQCLSQSNSFDCGSHLCVNALQAIRETFPTVETLSSSTDSLSERQLIDNLRNDMRQIIHKLASEPSL